MITNTTWDECIMIDGRSIIGISQEKRTLPTQEKNNNRKNTKHCDQFKLILML